MKTVLLLLCITALATACNQQPGKSESGYTDTGNTVVTTTDAALDYPYKMRESYKDWQPGDKKNGLLVMKMLKAWETKNLSECASYFGDSVYFNMDYFRKVARHDSLPAMLEESWANYASVKLDVDDWESVISKDKKEEWVTIWYKQTWIDKKGKTDSLAIVNDAKIANGKIVVFDETIRHFPTAKK
ncbi:hypothetical protein [Chitinophaga agri]|uniref:Nuclear transport factor 2 family protein n=1 Tax=Chitinophaga agri TaxID=2703787 RepID=A0A6B9ZBN9_9BACT|nr:hypothetical protein [Chitinophaga agri]QHS59718.1 hypothetical protein GWR21_08975 [Chitinophaga agri]